MRFINTKLFSPVATGQDFPRRGDLYHHHYAVIPDTKDEFVKFKKNKNVICDKQWWFKQRDRCINGYEVPGTLEFNTGDCLVEGKNVDVLENGDRYVRDCDVTIKGDTVRITGRHYFYLNFWYIQALSDKRKKFTHPKFTDLSWENWWIRERMLKEEKDNLWCKARQKGMSYEEACDVAWEYLFQPDSQSAIGAGIEKYNENMMKFVKLAMKRLNNTEFQKWWSKNTNEYMRSEYTGSEIYSRTTRNNVQALSSLSPSKVKLEEIGIWQKGTVKETAEFIKPSIEAEGEKSGYIQYIGTGGEVEDAVQDMEDMFYNPQSSNLLEFDNYYEESDIKIARFIPAWKYKIIDDEGNSIVKESLEKLEKEAAKKKPGERFRFWTQNPRYPSDIFQVGSGGFFGPDIIQMCNERKTLINNNSRLKNRVRVGRLEWNVSLSEWWKGVHFIDDENGSVVMLEPPEKDKFGKVYQNLYKVGTDSYDQDESKVSKSRGAAIVKKGFLHADKLYDTWVAYILERPETGIGGSPVFYENTAKLTVWYNCRNLIEYSKILIIQWYKSKKLFPLLKERPEAIISKKINEPMTVNDYGVDPNFVNPHGLKMLRDYLAKKGVIDRIFFTDLLHAFSRFRNDPKYNCDITIAAALTCIFEEDENEIEVKSSAGEREIADFTSYGMYDGMIIQN